VTAQHIDEPKKIGLCLVAHGLTVPETLGVAIRMVVWKWQRQDPKKQMLDDHGTMQQVVLDALLLIIKEKAHLHTVTHGRSSVAANRKTSTRVSEMGGHFAKIKIKIKIMADCEVLTGVSRRCHPSSSARLASIHQK